MHEKIARLAFRQLGLVTRQQLLGIGLSQDSIGYRLETGQLIAVHRCVYRIAGTPITFDQLLLAALLAAGPESAASDRAAAVVWKVEDVRAGRPEIAVPHQRQLKLEGVTVHRRRHFDLRDTRKVGPLRVTTPARTIADLAAVLPPDRLEDALDDVLRRKRATVEEVRAQVEKACRKPRNLLDLLANRDARNISGSTYENILRRLLVGAGCGAPVRQFVVYDGNGKFVARVDLAYPNAKLLLEYDGGHHEDPKQQAKDAIRQRKLEKLGFRVLRYTKEDVRKGATDTIREVKLVRSG